MQLNTSSPVALSLRYSQKNKSSSVLLYRREQRIRTEVGVRYVHFVSSEFIAKVKSINQLYFGNAARNSVIGNCNESIFFSGLFIEHERHYTIRTRLNKCLSNCMSFSITCNAVTHATGCLCCHFVFSFSNFYRMKLSLKEMFSFFFATGVLRFEKLTKFSWGQRTVN